MKSKDSRLVLILMALVFWIQQSKAVEQKDRKVQHLEAELTTLARRYSADELALPHVGGRTDHGNEDLSRVYGQKVDSLIGRETAEGELADLAIWAERVDPWFKSSNYVYRYTFEKNVQRIGKAKGQRAAKALNRVKETVIQDHRFDGHLAEVITEAESTQSLNP